MHPFPGILLRLPGDAGLRRERKGKEKAPLPPLQ